MTAIARFGAVSFDSSDPRLLGRFYRDLLEFDLRYESDHLVVLVGGGVTITVEHVADHRPPDWPGNDVPKQMHLDLLVDDLDSAEAAAIEHGAVRAEFQPVPDRWRVLIDPAGHPFCLALAPDTAG
ncbi:VOC family protein [Nocardia bovistercoris]|uniref:VOC family protein n=1 Tax=Nocardia bovistercoris TaxID=2785916 RepID=A0A931IEL6_9NOCA|nr:VOC family protein [Nocardia bovistercoris]MBH0780014.1 VOC family protein [Nocardia bovistercoris]